MLPAQRCRLTTRRDDAYLIELRVSILGTRRGDANMSQDPNAGPVSQPFAALTDVQFARGTGSGVQIPVANADANTRIAVDFGWVGGVAASLSTLQLAYSGSLGDTVPNADWAASNSGGVNDNMVGDVQRPYRLVAYEAQNLPGIQVLNASGVL